MDRNHSSSAPNGRAPNGSDNGTDRDDLWNWIGDDQASERVTEAVRRWLEGMENAIATATSEREI
jgi:hypothetical protein